CVPPRYVGQKLTVKADSGAVAIYEGSKEVAAYARSWERGCVFGAERFQKELFAQLAAAQQRLVRLLGPASEYYLNKLAETDPRLARQIRELLELVRDYGPEAVAAAMEKAHAAQAFGADYVANILRQQQTRRNIQPPLRLKHSELNELATDPLS